MHLRKPRLTYSACTPFNRNKEKIQKFKETGDAKYIYQKESEEQLLIKYYVIKHLILLKIQNMMDIKGV